MTPDPTTARTALVTGATGYIGGLLVPRLLDEGWRVRVLTRRRGSLDDVPWRDAVEVVEGDASTRSDLDRALDGAGVAYFLIHSMGDAEDFAEHDRRLARSFGAAAREAGVGRIVYLSGLHPEDEELSPHLASRVEVGDILMRSGVPTAVLQAAVVLGDGSASFDMLRYLASRLPAMVAPKWLHNRIQPIAIDDVIHYLVGAADLPADANRTFDIGGPQVMTYEEMLQAFVEATGQRRRVIVTVPVLTPRLASHWVGLVTPIPPGLAKPLVGSLVHEVVCHERDIATYVPDPAGGLVGFEEAVGRAMRDATPDRGPRILAGTAAAVAACALVGAAATRPGSRWYRSLDLPSWQPPAEVFPVVWTALYADIAATSAATLSSLAREGRDEEAQAYRRALGVNLGLNALWSVLFFRARRPGLATVEAAALAASSADLVRRTAAENATRGKLLAPYAAWTAFATALTWAVARRNRG